jgi:hypothetical protein
MLFAVYLLQVFQDSCKASIVVFIFSYNAMLLMSNAGPRKSTDVSNSHGFDAKSPNRINEQNLGHGTLLAC